MLKFIKSILFTGLFFYTFAASANSFTMVPVSDPPEPPPVPSAFGTVEGTAGLNSEVLQSGNITVDAGIFSASANLNLDGSFSLPVSTDYPFSIQVDLDFNNVADLMVSMENNTQLTQNEVRSFDLTHPSGRLLTKVIVLDGTLQNINVSASSSTININGLSESFTANGSEYRNKDIDIDPEILFAMPSGIITTLTGNITATNQAGCTVSLVLPERSITINDASLPAYTDPDIQEWTVDLTNDPTSCPTSTISGNFSLDGLDDIDIDLFSEHQLTFSGSDRTTINIINSVIDPISFPYSYATAPVLEGTYRTIEISEFVEPYTNLRLPRATIEVLGDTNFDSIHAVGALHGNINLTGEWDYTNISNARVTALGSEPGSTTVSMFANDDIDLDLNKGNFNFILAVGDWNANRYALTFKSVALSGRNYRQTLNFDIATKHAITKGVLVNLTPLSLTTASTQIELLVKQPAGETVTINGLVINGDPVAILDSSANTLGTSTFSSTSNGTEQTSFTVTLHGLAGTYEMTAKGTGTDGRDYEVTFPVTLGDTGPTDPGGDEDSMACYVINKVKLHQHQKASKDKLHIKYAGFRLPENAMVDLADEDVSISVDSMVYDFPAGTFKQKGNKYNYEYKSASGVIPKIKASINFEKSKWSLKVNHADIDEVDNSDGVDISLSIGNYLGTENVLLESKNKHHDKLTYKRKPKDSCRIGKTHKDDNDDDVMIMMTNYI